MGGCSDLSFPMPGHLGLFGEISRHAGLSSALLYNCSVLEVPSCDIPKFSDAHISVNLGDLEMEYQRSECHSLAIQGAEST